MWPLLVVVMAEGAESHTALGHGGALMHVQARITNRSVEPLLLAILPGLALLDIQRLNPRLCKPRLDGRCHKLSPIIAAQVGWRTVPGDQRGQDTDNAFGRGRQRSIDGQAFACG